MYRHIKNILKIGCQKNKNNNYKKIITLIGDIVKEDFSFKKIPIWLLSFLFVNILYMFFKDFVFYSVSLVLIASFIIMKLKNKSSFLVIELIISALFLIINVICIINKDLIVFKMIILNLESWLLMYIFFKNNYHNY